MSSVQLSVSQVSTSVLDAYDTLQPATQDDHRVNLELKQHVATWFSSSNRKLNQASKYCIDRFVSSEIDFKTPGDRGPGRMTSFPPRFGGKYGNLLERIDSNLRSSIADAFANHILCGYFFCEHLLECRAGRLIGRDRFPDGPEGVFNRWVPTIYYQLGPPVFDKSFSQDNGQSYWDAKGLWGNATGHLILDYFEKIAVPHDDFADGLIRKFFDAGIMLRITEIKRISESQHFDNVTAGGYSASKILSQETPQRGGCMSVFLISAVGLASVVRLII